MMRPPLYRLALTLGVAASLLAAPARAQVVVFDPTAYGQLIQQISQGLSQLQALQQQVTQGQKALAALTTDITAPFTQIRDQATQLLQQAQGLGYQTANLASAFDAAYPASLSGQSPSQIAASLANWQARTRQTLQEAMALQSQIVQGQPAASNAVSQAVSLSQAASGQTSAIQASNQLLAAVSSQLTQLQNLMLSTARAAQTAQAEQQALTAAAAAESQRSLNYTPPPSRIANGGSL